MNKEVRAEFFRFRASQHYLTGAALTNCARVYVPADSYAGRDERDTAARSRHVLRNTFRKKRVSVARVQFSRPRKIFSSQHALDPDIDREGAEAFVGKKHHTISNLRAHAGQRAQLCPKIGIGKHDPCFEIRFTRANKLALSPASFSRDNQARIRAVPSPSCRQSVPRMEM